VLLPIGNRGLCGWNRSTRSVDNTSLCQHRIQQVGQSEAARVEVTKGIDERLDGSLVFDMLSKRSATPLNDRRRFQ
jgi:hypothetical protein